MPKQKINGYLLFIQDMKRTKSEWSSRTIPELVGPADPFWNKLSQQQKDEYNNRAKEMRGLEPVNGRVGSGVPGVGAMDSLGRSLKDLALRDMEERKVAEKKIRDLHSLITPQVENNNLEQFVFFVIHTSVFAQTTPEKGQPAMFVPAEIAISKFSLSEGLIATYQAFPVPGKVPMGYKRTCMEQSKKLEIPFAELQSVEGFYIKEKKEIKREIKEFLGGNKICFLLSEFEEQVKGVMEGLDNETPGPSLSLTYLSLSGLLSALADITHSVAERELEIEKFLYRKGLSCDWHENYTETDKCCQAMLARWIFTVLDKCCPIYKVEMVPGKHQPKEVQPVKACVWGVPEAAKRTKTSGLRMAAGLFGAEDIRYRDSDASVLTMDSYQQHLESIDCEDRRSVSSRQEVETVAESLSSEVSLSRVEERRSVSARIMANFGSKLSQ